MCLYHYVFSLFNSLELTKLCDGCMAIIPTLQMNMFRHQTVK